MRGRENEEEPVMNGTRATSDESCALHVVAEARAPASQQSDVALASVSRAPPLACVLQALYD